MAGIILITAVAAWLILAGLATNAIVRRTRLARAPRAARIAIYPFVAILPVVWDLVGYWQFTRLCDAEAKVWVAPNAKQVVAARDNGTISKRSGLVVPVTEQVVSYYEVGTGQTFFTARAFHTPGGFMTQIVRMGNEMACWPDDGSTQQQGLDIDELLKRGK